MSEKKALNLTIASVAKTYFSGEAKSISLPGVLGVLQILANHEPIISNLKKGVVKIEHLDKKIEKIEIEKGILEVSENQATILITSEDVTEKPENSVKI